MQSNRTAPTSAKATGKSQQHEQTVNFHKTSSQPSERARADYDLTVQRDWGRCGARSFRHGTTRDSPMLQRWQNETTKEQPYNAIKTTERAWGGSGGGKGGQEPTGQAQSSSREWPVLQRCQNEIAKEQPYHAIGAVGVRRDRSFVPPKGGEKAWPEGNCV
ncbi:hypothetical protein BDR22DRAFT_892110 [Usnea florida]